MKRKSGNIKNAYSKNEPIFNTGNPEHSVKFIVLFLLGMILFSVVFYLIQEGIVIVRW